MAASEKKKFLNFNVGVLGHVDSGKTSLAKILSSIASTASFDKNPQSRERGITLDLGFSSFIVEPPDHLQQLELEKFQFTLVDCPGHASLIRTIMGGAQIIDLMMLVVDVTKGIQTQTAECLIIGQITCDKMIVVLNKIDLLDESKRQAIIDKMTKRIQKTLEPTKFAGSSIVSVSAKPGGPESTDTSGINIQGLIDTLKSNAFSPKRSTTGPFIYAVDHCFLIKGQGTVMTGTILSGKVSVNDQIEIPALKEVKKVKSMQMFKKPIEKAIQGDRIGLCVTQFDPKLLERGLVCSINALPTIDAAIVDIKKIQYYKGSVQTKSKFHITVGYETVMGNLTFFSESNHNNDEGKVDSKFTFDSEYKYEEELLDVGKQYLLVEFERPVICSADSYIIGSRLDTDVHANICRLAFYGSLVKTFGPNYSKDLEALKIFKWKQRQGVVERKTDDYTVVCNGLFKKESNIEAFRNLKVELSTGEKGVIESSFGQSGKFKVRLSDGLKEETSELISSKKKKQEAHNEIVRVNLKFKRYIYDSKKRMIQT
ncbi:DgyrCDS754 [Dimorphilus gyrociliatus]|uniref:Selenocysteine-specific elongation factor n=1 Tax=Dimorphilus gyrociliatus TaxID=2664684 RepID=A0A7I8V7C7_9ANNE|nr:DgyrCDS754 [Dimorphilus gyrociliatus]